MFEYKDVTIFTEEKRITEHISFSINNNETVAMIGRTGSGKTMTALSIMGLLPPNVYMKGTIEKDNAEISLKERTKMLGDKIVYIPQNGHEFLCPSLRVKTQLKDTLKRLKIKEDISKDLLEAVGFDNPGGIADMYPYELSGGMAQRVTMAMALAAKPELVIADEATNGLNYSDSLRFIEKLKELFPGSSRLVITHDLNVASLCDSIIVMHNGKILLQGNRDSIMNSTHPYIASLRNAMPENGMTTITLYEEDSP